MQAFFPQDTNHRIFQPRNVHIVGVRAKDTAELGYAGITGGLGLVLRCGAGGDADFTLAGFAIDGGSGIFTLKKRRHLAGNAALPAQNAQGF